MIYAKIYLDRDADGTDTLVFDSCRDSVTHFLRTGGLREEHGHRTFMMWTVVYDLQCVAISHEAKELFAARLKEVHGDERSLFTGDFALWHDKQFAFRPDAIKKAFTEKSMPPYASEGKTVRHLRADEKFIYCAKQGLNIAGLDEMIECDNDVLKRLDISSPVDPAALGKV